MIRISNIKAPLDYEKQPLARFAASLLKLREDEILSARLSKKSVDARDKRFVHFVLTLDVQLRRESQQVLDRLPVRAAFIEPEAAPAPLPHASFDERPVVVGLGPAGLFAAWTLAQAGARPIVLERGRDVDRRARDVQAFFSGVELDETSNVQFGEGGAGAFSDGKLNTGISDPRCRRVLETLHECGAPEEILYLAKPHVGTDRLPGVVKALRERIVLLGGTVLFEHRLSALHLENGRLAAIDVIGPDGEAREMAASTLILAIGHSARDTFEMLYRAGLTMIQKPFSLGARIEHPQSLVSRSQYGEAWRHPALGAADYKLSEKLPNGRSAYTFCMCPGGTVVAAASEKGGVVTNGMSEFARDGKNANSALLVGVEPSDFGGDDPLAGVRLQQKWERAAFLAGGENYRAPAQRVGDFLKGVPSTSAGDVEPTYRPGVTYTSLDSCLPDFVAETMRLAITRMDRRLHGFASPGALLTGVETRSSSPLRITRNERCVSSVEGIYPCGEGAGYAGGILSAAVDGIRCAEAALSAHCKGE